MTYTPTPEEFLAQQTTAEDDEETFTELHAGVAADPLETIARSMEALVSLVQRLDAQASDVVALRGDLTGLQGSYQRLLDESCAKQALIDQVLEVCKPSTSKLANAIRAVLEPEPAVDQESEPDPDPDTAGLIQPHPEAPVEEWRAYARSRGYAGPDVDKANRSQIRTMLGIAQPVSEVDAR